MSEASPSRKLGPIRHLNRSERDLVRRLLLLAGATPPLDRVDSLEVRDMPDGGMGSLYFVSAATDAGQRRFGRRIAEFQFNDVDGIAVIASLNVDTDGNLFELDIWKTDFEPVVKLNPS